MAVVALVAAALLVSLVPAQRAAASTTVSYRIWHWNIAGHAYHLGSTTDGIIEAMRGSISYRDPDFVSVNEMCHSQYDAMIDQLQNMGWPQDPLNFARFEPMLPAGDPTICAGTAYGIALFSRFPLGTTDRYTLPSDGQPKARKLLCAAVKATPQVRFCTTHITTVQSYQQSQLDYVRGVLDGYRAAGGTVLIAGDFNVQPHETPLDPWYVPAVDTVNNGNNSGAYHELDDQDPICPGWGEETTENDVGGGACGQARKVDMVFTGADRLISYWEDPQPIGSICGAHRDLPCSDHRIVDADATVTVG
ncbi:hypothetical protein GCM10022220_61380 [Actinocatenispora rupis]